MIVALSGGQIVDFKASWSMNAIYVDRKQNPYITNYSEILYVGKFQIECECIVMQVNINNLMCIVQNYVSR